MSKSGLPRLHSGGLSSALEAHGDTQQAETAPESHSSRFQSLPLFVASNRGRVGSPAGDHVLILAAWQGKSHAYA